MIRHIFYQAPLRRGRTTFNLISCYSSAMPSSVVKVMEIIAGEMPNTGRSEIFRAIGEN